MHKRIFIQNNTFYSVYYIHVTPCCCKEKCFLCRNAILIVTFCYIYTAILSNFHRQNPGDLKGRLLCDMIWHGNFVFIFFYRKCGTFELCYFHAQKSIIMAGINRFQDFSNAPRIYTDRKFLPNTFQTAFLRKLQMIYGSVLLRLIFLSVFKKRNLF